MKPVWDTPIKPATDANRMYITFIIKHVLYFTYIVLVRWISSVLMFVNDMSYLFFSWFRYFYQAKQLPAFNIVQKSKRPPTSAHHKLTFDISTSKNWALYLFIFNFWGLKPCLDLVSVSLQLLYFFLQICFKFLLLICILCIIHLIHNKQFIHNLKKEHFTQKSKENRNETI